MKTNLSYPSGTLVANRMTEIPVSYDDKAVEACRYWSGAFFPFMYKYDVHDPKEIDEHAKFVGREA